ncbi:MAG: hypothetical protein ACMZ66_11070 [Thalassospira sp.]|uniref:hypothetical protein n=1 Tax=Thalassospira sp. TaxID=1912094 RepID=UPI003A8A8B19
MRFLSCILVLAISLTVLLSGGDRVQAHASDANMPHQGMMIDVSAPVSHDPHSSHADICGMTVCGPFVEDKDSVLMFMPVVSSMKYWVKHRPMVSADQDVSIRPPRS